MAIVFLSYVRSDADRARAIALALEKAGHSVWWDRHIKGGAQYSKEIETALKAAEAVVVLWSAQSIDSAWVRDEAAAGRDSGRLVPVMIDGTEPPLGFRQFQSISLAGWKRRGRSAEFDQLLMSIGALGETNPKPAIQPSPVQRPTVLASGRRLLAAAALVVLLAVGGYAVWKLTVSTRSTPTVTVVAADQSAATKDVTHDLMVMLGSLQSVEKSSMTLVENSAQDDLEADLVFKASAAANQLAANLVLMSGKDRTILWSKDFKPPSDSPGDLKQQLSYTAARVLDCALEALNPNGGEGLDPQTLRLYLNGCAQFAELIGTVTAEIIPLFEKVTSDAPRFEPGWAKLLMAEISTTDLPGDTQERFDPARVRRHIAQARQVNPRLAEVALAEISLLPSTALSERAQLIDRSLRLEPDNADLLASRSKLYASVGRLNEAILDAKRASQLEPLSPAFRHTYISMLSHAGQLEAAFHELERAERVWPGASNMVDARFRLHIFYGDPKEALRLVRKGITNYQPYIATVLNARIDPNTANLKAAKDFIRFGLRNRPLAATGPVHGHGQFGIAEELFSILDPAVQTEPELFSVLFRPPFREFRKDKRFIVLAARFGLVEYWHKTGVWPDYCREPDLPYDCKAEAAKRAGQS